MASLTPLPSPSWKNTWLGATTATWFAIPQKRPLRFIATPSFTNFQKTFVPDSDLQSLANANRARRVSRGLFKPLVALLQHEAASEQVLPPRSKPSLTISLPRT